MWTASSSHVYSMIYAMTSKQFQVTGSSIHQGRGESSAGAGILIDPGEVSQLDRGKWHNQFNSSRFRQHAPALANSSALQFPRTLLCSGTQTSETLKRLGSGLFERCSMYLLMCICVVYIVYILPLVVFYFLHTHSLCF